VKRRRRQTIEERRRALLEFNLIGEPRSRSVKVARKGCALFGSGTLLVAILTALAATYLGLH
jgi:hypothetical protein